jgi:hypothetical protein
MRIALFYPKNFYASWYALGGYREALSRMGHDVLDCPFPGNQIQQIEPLRKVMPSVDGLLSCDCVLSMYHEYSQPWLEALYGLEAWQRVMENVPVTARFDETMDRADLKLPHRLPELMKWAHFYSFPGAQDAEKHRGQWLPYGADTTMFKFGFVDGKYAAKKYDVGFIGSLYPLRAEYLQRLAEHMDGLTFNVGQVFVQGLGGMRERESTELLAEEYRAIKVFFCLPPMSRLLVCKVFEVMACGTFVMYPKSPWHARANMGLFKDKEEIVYYDAGYISQNAREIKRWVEDDEGRERIAKAGCSKVHAEYTLDGMLEKLLALKDGFHKANILPFRCEEVAAK